MPTSAISLRTSIASVVPVTVALCETADYTPQLLLLLPLDYTCWHAAFRQNFKPDCDRNSASAFLVLPYPQRTCLSPAQPRSSHLGRNERL